ncbi:RNA polymerase II [Dasineura jujubifolia toursvirus 2a]|nr:RNA polymerase II [Dasineura jujubifolia toursvirus 2a]
MNNIKDIKDIKYNKERLTTINENDNDQTSQCLPTTSDTDISNMVIIDYDLSESIFGFIKPRGTIPKEAELVIIEKQKDFFRKQIIGKKINVNVLPTFKKIMKEKFMSSLMQPGESVGIICGQCIGERTTQSSLNNFHSAGLDTGSTSQIESLQNIINASKSKKSEVRKYFRVSLFLNSKPKTLRELSNETVHVLEEVNMKTLLYNDNLKYPHTEYKNISINTIKNYISEQIDSTNCLVINKILTLFTKKINNCTDMHFIDCVEDNTSIWDKKNGNIIQIRISLEKLFSYRITREQLLKRISNSHYIFALPYSLIKQDAQFYTIFVNIPEAEDNLNLNQNSLGQVFEFIRNLRSIPITGIEGVNSHAFVQSKDGEWYIDCMCNSINVFMMYQDIFDVSRITCNSIHDMCSNFGVLAAQELILGNCKFIMPDIDECHFMLLAMRMTRNGFIEPLTRYTMRNTPSPLSKASFEESFETFLKACKFNESEKFKSVSSSIICGKKPTIGTYQCDILVDSDFYIS